MTTTATTAATELYVHVMFFVCVTLFLFFFFGNYIASRAGPLDGWNSRAVLLRWCSGGLTTDYVIFVHDLV